MYIVSYVAYLMLGGMAIGAIEEENRSFLKSKLMTVKKEFLEMYNNVNGS